MSKCWAVWMAFLRVWWSDWCCLTTLAVALSAPSATLSVTPSCVVWLTCWREGMPSREILTGLRGGNSQNTVHSGVMGMQKYALSWFSLCIEKLLMKLNYPIQSANCVTLGLQKCLRFCKPTVFSFIKYGYMEQGEKQIIFVILINSVLKKLSKDIKREIFLLMPSLA